MLRSCAVWPSIRIEWVTVSPQPTEIVSPKASFCMRYCAAA